MNTFDELIDSLCVSLRQSGRFDGVNVKRAYLGEMVQAAPSGSEVVAEAAAVSLTGAALGGLVENGKTGKRMSLSVKFYLSCPIRCSEQNCMDLFDRLCAALLFDSGYDVRALACSSASVDPDRHTYTRTVTAVLDMLYLKS